jgi:nitroimidazol reductase NimA-like FMN-containing flavoprotein (pyridoxamine 5'-phosphate oxidase superfamily)
MTKIYGDFSTSEVIDFLSKSRSPLRLATIDSSGAPVINSIGFYFENNRLYIFSRTDSRKTSNIRRSNKVYFSVDTDTPPYKGVKGRAFATFIDDKNKALELVKKIALKFTGSLDNPMSQAIIGQVRSGEYTALELRPVFYTTWG